MPDYAAVSQTLFLSKQATSFLSSTTSIKEADKNKEIKLIELFKSGETSVIENRIIKVNQVTELGLELKSNSLKVQEIIIKP